MILFGVYTLVLVLALLAIVPKTNEALRSHKRLVVVLAIAYVTLWSSLPYILGIQGRFGETVFERQIHKGMSRSEVLQLAVKNGGTSMAGGALLPDDNAAGGFLVVQFVDFSTFCVGAGKEFDLHFLKSKVLAYWKVGKWTEAC